MHEPPSTSDHPWPYRLDADHDDQGAGCLGLVLLAASLAVAALVPLVAGAVLWLCVYGWRAWL